jgi:hypothetical protein
MSRFSQVQRKLLILILRDCKLWISHISSKSLKSISETMGCAKMNIKGRERKRNKKGSAEMNLWTKVHGLSETRWHRFLSAAQDIPVTYPVTVTPSSYLPPFTPRLRTVKEEGEKVISWRFEDSTKDFKAWDKVSFSNSVGPDSPQLGLQQHSHHVRR